MKSTLSISSLSRQVLLRETRDYLMIALGMILYGIGWTVFLLPNDITTGGVPGIASIVFWATGFPVQYTYFLINAVLLMLALKILGLSSVSRRSSPCLRLLFSCPLSRSWQPGCIYYKINRLWHVCWEPPSAEVVSVSLSPRTVVRVERILLPLSSINTGI